MALVSLNGWDVVSLVSVTLMNAAIAASNSSPTEMQVSTETLTAHATFGTWQITVGGSQTIIMFAIPLKDVTGNVTKDGDSIAQWNYPSLMAKVELTLTFIDSGTHRQLTIDIKNPPTTVVSLVDDDGQPLSDALNDAFIKQALITWLDANLSKFNQIFGSINLDPSVGSDTQWSFCKPSVVAYTYVSGNSLASSYLGMTYNTGGKTQPGTVAQIDPSFIPSGSQGAFLISPELFLVNFLAPAACIQFKIPPPSLKVDTTQLTATMAAGVSIAMPKVKTSKGTYTPHLTDFQLAVENSIIVSTAKTSAKVLDKWYGTVTAYNESRSWMALGLNKPGRTLIWSNTQPSINNHWNKKSKSFEIVQDVLEAIGIFVGAVATILTDGAALLVVGALFGVAEGGIQWAVAEMDSQDVNAAPEVDELVANISLPTEWTGAGPFAVSQVGLYQGGLFLAGTMGQSQAASDQRHS